MTFAQRIERETEGDRLRALLRDEGVRSDARIRSAFHEVARGAMTWQDPPIMSAREYQRREGITGSGRLYRLVTDSNGTVEASSVLLTAADAVDMLAAEVLIHRLAGWRVSVSGEGFEVAISAERGESRRIVTVEEDAS